MAPNANISSRMHAGVGLQCLMRGVRRRPTAFRRAIWSKLARNPPGSRSSIRLAPDSVPGTGSRSFAIRRRLVQNSFRRTATPANRNVACLALPHGLGTDRQQLLPQRRERPVPNSRWQCQTPAPSPENRYRVRDATILNGGGTSPGQTRNQMPGNRLRVRIPFPPLAVFFAANRVF